MPDLKTYTAFHADRRVAAGELARVLADVASQGLKGVLVFDDETGDLVKLSTPAEIDQALRPMATTAELSAPRELSIRLLPRHLTWLQTQPGGPAAAIRRLVDAARREGTGRARLAQEAAYRFVSMMAGDREGFEAASRALFAGDRAGFAATIADWPRDLRAYSLALAGDGLA